jgi:hypothetical protein
MKKHPFSPNFLLIIPLSIFKVFLATMLEWNEKEHKNDDFFALQYQQTMNTLRNYELLKLSKTHSMRKEIMILEHIIVMWYVIE